MELNRVQTVEPAVSTGVTEAAAPTAGWAGRLAEWIHRPRLPAAGLIAIITAGIAFRVWMMARASWMIDGDEAIFGIMGRHILQGERPIFFYGQAYMGAWPAYVAALFYELFGMSRESYRLITIPSYVALALSVYFLARRTYGVGTALLATALTAIPSIYVLSVSGHLWGGIADSMAIGNVILLLAIDEAYGATRPRRSLIRFAAIGLLGGFGFWIHGQTAIYLAAAGALIFMKDKLVVLRPRTYVAAAAFVVGALPVFNFATNHKYTTFHHLLGVGADDVKRQPIKLSVYYLTRVLPRVSGLAAPWYQETRWLEALGALVIAATVVALGWRRRWGLLDWLRLSLRRGEPKDGLILFGLVMSAAFVFSNFGNLALLFPSIDAKGRYAIPLAPIISIIVAGELLHAGRRYSVAIPVLGLLILGASSVVGYARSSPTDPWQSPYWRKLPASNADLIATLDQMGVTAVWMNHWAGSALIFDTQERISASDYYDLRVGHAIDRLGSHSRRVEAAELPAFVFVTDNGRVTLEDWLTSNGIPFEKRALPHYVVIHPLQHVDPARVVDYLGFEQ
jgi:4-amino-4-deoxy-L-arabinose transferase-like glycosyltransferase